MSFLIFILYGLSVVSLLIFFGAAVILWFFPKEKILSVKFLEKTFKGTAPARGALNKFGKRVDLAFNISGFLLVISVPLVLFLEEKYGVGCINGEEQIINCIIRLI